jgi:tetratricopeptide (TPR) repeat protein
MAILNNWSVASWRAGDVARALQALDEVIAINGHRGPGGEPPLYVLANRARALLALGRFRAAEEGARGTEALAERIGAPPIWRRRLLVTRLDAVIEQRRFADAVVLADEVRRVTPLTKAGADPHALPLAMSRLAQLRGDGPAALAALQPVFDAYPNPADPASLSRGDATLALALRRRADIALAAGDATAALRDAEAAVAIGRRLQSGRQYALRTGQALVLVARARAALGRREQARAAAAEAVGHLEAMQVDGADADLAQARRLAS